MVCREHSAEKVCVIVLFIFIRKTFCGTYEYMAPEIVLDLPYDYTIDIWSIGILLFELVHGYAPFKGKEYNEIAANIKECKIKCRSNLSKPLVTLIT